ncbi:hypothetical protein [Paramagnetospirillum magneticum]|uniref:Uncharacterized protein n=1 Tax=Paramagnetospirillum magneticum (strain ATCC 700264 / AMB-1) TaxID=342108 RepID=Q2W4I1_PARM1|nr:hypothetical protein [Paramagnetospirillum magneticum]BAE51203.1 hypothetical protein amb2399 [Paramagnetospirillum magneticum AMB-1]BAE51244.1 hypothetical protein amb2440 [Paramagnetospirillum magneticum AMB-1]
MTGWEALYLHRLWVDKWGLCREMAADYCKRVFVRQGFTIHHGIYASGACS